MYEDQVNKKIIILLILQKESVHELGGARGKERKEAMSDSESEEAETFVVESILDVKNEGTKKVKYLIKWRGYDDQTWEPLANLACPLLLKKFQKERVSQKAPVGKRKLQHVEDETTSEDDKEGDEDEDEDAYEDDDDNGKSSSGDVDRDFENRRKSKRAKTSRFFNIGGHRVLKLNNYTMQEGEPSVFDRESTTNLTGPGYIHELEQLTKLKLKSKPSWKGAYNIFLQNRKGSFAAGNLGELAKEWKSIDQTPFRQQVHPLRAFLLSLPQLDLGLSGGEGQGSI